MLIFIFCNLSNCVTFTIRQIPCRFRFKCACMRGCMSWVRWEGARWTDSYCSALCFSCETFIILALQINSDWMCWPLIISRLRPNLFLLRCICTYTQADWQTNRQIHRCIRLDPSAACVQRGSRVCLLLFSGLFSCWMPIPVAYWFVKSLALDADPWYSICCWNLIIRRS